MASLLCILDQGYRATVEEQDDTAIWLAHMLTRNDGTSTTVVLRQSAVNYAVRARPMGVRFGEWTQAHPADLARDLQSYTSDGGRVFVVREDLVARGLAEDELIDGVSAIARSEIAGLAVEHDHLSFW